MVKDLLERIRRKIINEVTMFSVNQHRPCGISRP